MKPMFSRYAFFALVVFGAMFLVPEAKAQPYGSLGWCPPTGCDGGFAMNVSVHFGACPGGLVTCPITGMGCIAGQSGNCC